MRRTGYRGSAAAGWRSGLSVLPTDSEELAVDHCIREGLCARFQSSDCDGGEIHREHDGIVGRWGLWRDSHTCNGHSGDRSCDHRGTRPQTVGGIPGWPDHWDCLPGSECVYCLLAARILADACFQREVARIWPQFKPTVIRWRDRMTQQLHRSRCCGIHRSGRSLLRFAGLALPIHCGRLGVSAREIGGRISTCTAATPVSRPLVGWGPDRYGRKWS